jgi:xanthine dehydrogenase accessory factor
MTEWPRLLAFAELHFGAPLALATLVQREGAGYRQPGARMIITAHGTYAGSLTGGCLEDDITRSALGVIVSGCSILRTIDTRPHYGCRGRLHILIERVEIGFFNRLATHVQARIPCWLRTCFSFETDTMGTVLFADPDACMPEGPGYLIEHIDRQPLLLVVSGSEDAEPVCRFASSLGWQVNRILPVVGAARPGSAFAGTPCAAESLLLEYPPDERTAVLVMTHNLGDDIHYLRHALPASYAYVGLFGAHHRRDMVLSGLGGVGLLSDGPAPSWLRSSPSGHGVRPSPSVSAARRSTTPRRLPWSDSPCPAPFLFSPTAPLRAGTARRR